jgi:parvulin-like peptidyl-prolyl isomerase
LRDASVDEVTRTFGTQFAQALASLPAGRWSDPVTSDFGVHVVRIDARTPARLPALAEVRREVARDVLHARTQSANEGYYETLRRRYTVRIEADLDRSAAASGTQSLGAQSLGAQ